MRVPLHRTLRVATFNIKHGSRDDGRVDHRDLLRACALIDADVLALQEVDCHRWRSAFRDQAGLVARQLGYRAVFDPVVTDRRFAGYGFGGYGNALLARGEIRDVGIMRLPRPNRRQPRGAILARIGVSGANISVATTHLQHHPARMVGTPKEAPDQLRVLLRELQARPLPRLVLGDFNIGAKGALPILADAGFASVSPLPTFPRDEPRIALDHIAVAGLTVVQSETVATPVSDHRALVAEIAV